MKTLMPLSCPSHPPPESTKLSGNNNYIFSTVRISQMSSVHVADILKGKVLSTMR